MTTRVKIQKSDDHVMPVLVQEQHLKDDVWVNVGTPKVLFKVGEMIDEYVYQTKRFIVYENPLESN